MDLYLIRHTDALPMGERGITEDAERPLSDKGEKQARILGKGFQTHGIHLDQMVASPLLRARQTAEILIGELSAPPPLVQYEEVSPQAGMKKAARKIRSLAGERIGVVGHLPHLGLWTAWLIGSKKAKIALSKGGVAYITFSERLDKGLGTLVWLVSPEWFGHQ